MKYVIANWKMNGNLDLLNEMKNKLVKNSDAKIIMCPPAYLLMKSVELGFETGGQDCSKWDKGAYTGEISAEMLKEIGVKYVILGHSEVREYHNESDEIINLKGFQAVKYGLKPIICIGETLEEYQANNTECVLENQLMSSACGFECIVAYEPRWAIGTGKTPTIDEIIGIHSFLKDLVKRQGLKVSAILYGGSVNAENAGAILNIDVVDGVLVGGASLKVLEFQKIINAVK